MTDEFFIPRRSSEPLVHKAPTVSVVKNLPNVPPPGAKPKAKGHYVLDYHIGPYRVYLHWQFDRGFVGITKDGESLHQTVHTTEQAAQNYYDRMKSERFQFVNRDSPKMVPMPKDSEIVKAQMLKKKGGKYHLVIGSEKKRTLCMVDKDIDITTKLSYADVRLVDCKACRKKLQRRVEDAMTEFTGGIGLGNYVKAIEHFKDTLPSRARLIRIWKFMQEHEGEQS